MGAEKDGLKGRTTICCQCSQQPVAVCMILCCCRSPHSRYGITCSSSMLLLKSSQYQQAVRIVLLSRLQQPYNECACNRIPHTNRLLTATTAYKISLRTTAVHENHKPVLHLDNKQLNNRNKTADKKNVKTMCVGWIGQGLFHLQNSIKTTILVTLPLEIRVDPDPDQLGVEMPHLDSIQLTELNSAAVPPQQALVESTPSRSVLPLSANS